MKLKAKVLWCALLPLVLGACAPTYRGTFMDQANEKHWDEQHKLDAYYYSFRLLWLKKNEDGTFAVVYSRLPKAEVVRQLEQNVSDLEDMLNYRDKESTNFIDFFKLRPYLTRQELILKAVLARALADDHNTTFNDMLGEVSQTLSQSDEFGYNHATKGFDGSIFSLKDPRAAFPFTSKKVEEARAAGLLKEIERVTYSADKEMYQKLPDPSFPNDVNKFVWVSKKVATETVKYKVIAPDEKSTNNNPNYVEVWRITDGKRESYPAVKAFLTGSGNALMVLDADKEGEMGFGLPNVVASVPESALYGAQLVAQIFPDKAVRKEPKVPEVRSDIVYAGTPVDPWEKCADECATPKSYRREPLADNYNIRVSFKPSKHKDPSDTTKEIQYIAKEWWAGSGTSEYQWGPGQVVEYFEPKAQCDGKIMDVRVANTENKKKLMIICADGSEVSGIVTPKSPNKFVADKPTKIAFTVGETRWMVWDSDHDGKFDKRRKVSTTLKHDVGSYPSEEDAVSGH